MKHLYGEFTIEQIVQAKKSLRKDIFFLILCVDPKTSHNFRKVNVNSTFVNLMYKLNGLNSILLYQPEIVTIMSLLESARIEYNSPAFDPNENFEKSYYRKLVLDAGAEVLNLKEE